MFLLALIPFLINVEDISTTGAAILMIFEGQENIVLLSSLEILG
jgi:hypothetical protein